ncbi:MAG: Hint domain-containing protein, partial [Paracoccaceae bacterium]
ADANTNFQAASGSSTSFDVQINSSNTNNFDLNFDTDTNPNVSIADNVDISDVKLDAANAESITLTAGNNVSIDEFTGSDGADTVTIGDDFTTISNFDMNDGSDTVVVGANADFSNQDIELGQGDNTFTAGPGLQVKDIRAEDGLNTISIGDGANIEDIDVKDGNNVITLGNGVTLNNINTDDGNNTITIGDNLSVNNINTGDGADTIVIGDNAVINDLKTDKGDDSVTLGDGFVIDKLETQDGDDFVRLGDGGTINSTLDGGNGNDRLSNGNAYIGSETNFETVVCFAAGTLIDTPVGQRPVEDLAKGDLVLTADNGPQRLQWVGQRVCSSEILAELPNLLPIRIRAGALGGGLPLIDLLVSPQHRVLVRSRIAQRMFGTPEVLVAAKQLLTLPNIEIAEDIHEITYVHLLCNSHEIVYSNGAPTETLYLGTEAMKSLDEDNQKEIEFLFPELDIGNPMNAARHFASGRQGRSLAARHLKNAQRLLAVPEALEA